VIGRVHVYDRRKTHVAGPLAMNSHARLRTVVLATLLASTVGACQRATPPESASTQPPHVPVPTPTPETPASKPETTPEDVLLAHVWQCDDGSTHTVRNLYRERAIVGEFGQDSPQRLDQVESASGVRHSNSTGSIVFWSSGRTATLERQGSPPVPCSEVRAASLREDARVRGVVYRALGNEPGWILEVGPGGRLDWTTNYGQDRYAFEGAIEATGGDASSRTFTASNASQSITVTVRAEPCTDDAGLAHEHSASIDFAGGTLRGCAVRLN
jgi:putative lipoprotein